jgi:hypothetical protein
MPLGFTSTGSGQMPGAWNRAVFTAAAARGDSDEQSAPLDPVVDRRHVPAFEIEAAKQEHVVAREVLRVEILLDDEVHGHVRRHQPEVGPHPVLVEPAAPALTDLVAAVVEERGPAGLGAALFEDRVGGPEGMRRLHHVEVRMP